MKPNHSELAQPSQTRLPVFVTGKRMSGGQDCGVSGPAAFYRMSSRKLRRQASAAQSFRLQPAKGWSQSWKSGVAAESILLEPTRLELIEKVVESSNSGGGESIKAGAKWVQQARLHPLNWLRPESSEFYSRTSNCTDPEIWEGFGTFTGRLSKRSCNCRRRLPFQLHVSLLPVQTPMK